MQESTTELPKRRLIRLACAGSAGGGKTTLVNHLAPRMWDLKTITYSRPTKAAEILGYTAAKEIPENELATFQWLGLIEQMTAERIAMASGRGFLADRSVLDFMAYNLYRVETCDPSYEAIARRWAKGYDAIIIVPPNSSPTEERHTRLMHGIQEVHETVVRLTYEFGLRDSVIELTTDTPKERVEEVIEVLRARGFTWNGW